jgi:uncharacterized protein YbbC (DUF1343 family)
MNTVLRSAVALLLAVATEAAAVELQTPASLGIDAARLSRIDALVEEALAAGETPGCVVAIGRRAGLCWLKAYGDRQVEPAREPMTTDTIFDLASITKPVATATAVMLLVEDGSIRLGDRISQHMPEFTGHDKETLTVQQLLTHQSGLIADNHLRDYEQGPAEAWSRICGLELVAPPGTRFIYSDVNFIVLGMLVERLAGESLDAFTRRRVFAPLGMTDTGYLPSAEQRPRCAPTEQRDGSWIRGDVHDPRAWKLGGVAGHAGLFGTASDLSRYARSLLGGGELDGTSWMAPATLATMVRSVRLPGGSQRGLGWDKRSGYSSNRGELFSPSAFGHGGFTGTSLWIDPELDLFVIFLGSRLHPDGTGSVNRLAGRIGTIAAAAIVGDSSPPAVEPARRVLTGIDVLLRDAFQPLAGSRVGLITNHTGRDRSGISTAKRLADAADVTLVALFSPEHGPQGTLDQEQIDDATDPETGVPIRSLYGATRRPTPEMLADIDTLVFDIQDVGTRYYTYISTMLEAMKAAADCGLRFVVLDRPNPINGLDIAGPVVDAGSESFVGCHPIALRHGMTVGELARMFAGELDLSLELDVIPCEGWRRQDSFDATGLEWTNPSPNMRSLTEALLYPGVGLLEFTNLSVGRGTDTPFEVVGAPWLDGQRLAAAFNARRIPGVACVPIRFTPTASRFQDEHCGGVNIIITDRDAFDPVRTGLELAVALRRLYPDEWDTSKLGTLLLDEQLLETIVAGREIDEVLELSNRNLRDFVSRRARFLMDAEVYP